MKTIYPSALEHRERHQLLLSGVAPRPIALVTTQDKHGNVNVSPFSFFNAYSSRPPIVAIGPAISSISGKAKDTLTNILETGECTISVVTYSMVEQISLASCEYDAEINEFEKSGLTQRASSIVKPPCVAESPYSMECTLHQFIPLFENKGGNGRILLMEVQLFHVSDSVYSDNKIDPRKMDLAARMGYDWYCRAHGDALFEVKKPRWNGIGVDALPEYIRTSEFLTGAELAKLASVKEIPEKNHDFSTISENISGDSIDIELASGNPLSALYIALQTLPSVKNLTRIAKLFLHHNDIESAWQVLLLIKR
ncbi:MAG TPA: flavin reductase family protein [Candidatus Kapabacteria bacterium]|jgi:flavin reductase (DIM6/NTAB) family NADH-FMN oxidoreductase RutF|nr:flavin reductase family protein [Ignavibacteria bacterium]HRE57946.1 flavin reductase family protein [Candidatus Kapabacteria bacterium]